MNKYQYIVSFPIGTTLIDGEPVDNQTLAQRIEDILKKGMSISIPDCFKVQVILISEDNFNWESYKELQEQLKGEFDA